MLNIISNEYFKSSDSISGPIKVFRNLIKGLDIIQYPYIINGDLESCDKLWIYNDPQAFKKLDCIDKKIKILLGPGFFLDRYLSENERRSLKRQSEHVVCLQPSEWSKNMSLHFGFNHTPLEAWPVGIDTDEFAPNFDPVRDVVLVYFKQRYLRELAGVQEVLKKMGLKNVVLVYGEYKENDYKKLLRRTRYVIWVGRQESQGIALQEALSMDVPVLVWDVKKVGHWCPPPKDVNIFTNEENEYAEATAIPYFDNHCGAVFFDAREIEEKITFMENNLNTFKPRGYILDTLTLAKQARDFLQIYDKYWGLKITTGYNDKLRTHKKWKNEILWKFLSKIYYLKNKRLLNTK